MIKKVEIKADPAYNLSSRQMILLIQSTIRSFIQFMVNQNKKIQEGQLPQQNTIIINQKLKKKLTQIMKSKNFTVREDRLNIFKRILSFQQAVVLQIVLRSQLAEDQAKELISKKVKYFYLCMLEIFAWLETFKCKIITSKKNQSRQNIEKHTEKALVLLSKISEMQTQPLQKSRLSTFYLLKLLPQSSRSQLSVDNQFVKEWDKEKKSFLALNEKKKQNDQIRAIIQNYIKKEEQANQNEIILSLSKKLLEQRNSRLNRKIESIMKEIERNFKYKKMHVLREVAQEINHHLDVFMTRFIRKVIKLAKISNQRLDSQVEGDQFRYFSQKSKNIYNLLKRPNSIIQKLQKYKEEESLKSSIKATKLTYPSKLEQYFKLRNSQQRQQLNLYKAVKQNAPKQNKKFQKYLFENQPQISDQLYQEEILPPSKRLKITRTVVMELIQQLYEWTFAAEAALYR